MGRSRGIEADSLASHDGVSDAIGDREEDDDAEGRHVSTTGQQAVATSSSGYPPRSKLDDWIHDQLEGGHHQERHTCENHLS